MATFSIDRSATLTPVTLAKHAHAHAAHAINTINTIHTIHTVGDLACRCNIRWFKMPARLAQR